MQAIKKLIAYQTCEKFDTMLYTALQERYKTTLQKDIAIIEVNDDELIILFKYGSFVCWNTSFDNIKFFQDFIKKYEIERFEESIVETLDYEISNEFSIKLDKLTLENSQKVTKIAISHAIAQNIKLEQFETEVQKSIEENSTIPKQLAKNGAMNLSKKEISKKIGELYLTKSKINLHYDLLDTPEFFWEHSEYEPHYERISKYLDIRSRVEVLNKKLEVIQELLNMLSNEQNHKYSSFLEWIIIILIAFEIIMNIAEHFL